MTPGAFLRMIWPSQGYYCLATTFKTSEGLDVKRHHVFDNISDAVSFVLAERSSRDIWFACLSMKNEKIWRPNKKDYKTGHLGAWGTRTGDNMGFARCSFFDLDVGDDPKKYPTQAAAIAGLKAFVEATQLPFPMLVSSGGGVHCYWTLESDMDVEAWRAMAADMRALAVGHGLLIDTMRTLDATSLLRPSGTSNFKDPLHPREVKVLAQGPVTPTDAFLQMVRDAVVRLGQMPAPPKTPAAPIGALPNNLHIDKTQDFGPPPAMADVAATCGQVREILRSQQDKAHPHHQLDNDAWYRGLMGTVVHVEDGANWARRITAKNPRTNADIEAKIAQIEGFAPAKCQTLRDVMPWGDSPCQSCKFFTDAHTPNPIVATRKSAEAPPPVIQLVTAAGTTTTVIPNPPQPYARLKAGGVARTGKDENGNESTDVIYDCDLYPLRRLSDRVMEQEQQVWYVELPRGGGKEFTIDADTLYDMRKFTSAMSNQGVYVTKNNLPYVQDYMVAYIAQLQREADAEAQSSHLGWSDDFGQFILPDKILHADGTVTPACLSVGAQRSSAAVTRKGDLVTQAQLLGFYNDRRYVAHQFMILSSLGAAIFHMTGHHGVIVNASGPAGSSKSTALYTAASLWGDAELYPINGTNSGATKKGLYERLSVIANLPVCVDEITHMPAKDATDLAMGITQPGHRIRLHTDGKERASIGSYKATMMLATANSSLHGLLSTDNSAGTAGSMRVIEIEFTPPQVHVKAQADAYLKAIKANFGWIGEAFLYHVIQNQDAVRAEVERVMHLIDVTCSIEAAERFWSAGGGAAIAAGYVAKQLGLIPFDVDFVLDWFCNRQVAHMRGVVVEEYASPLSILTDYLASINGNTIVIERNANAPQAEGYVARAPHGAMLAHHERADKMLFVLKKGFKDYCAKIGANSTGILDQLSVPTITNAGHASKVIANKNLRRTLGAGTDLAKGQSWCFAVNLAHPDIASNGLAVVANQPPQGPAQGAPVVGTASLKVVP